MNNTSDFVYCPPEDKGLDILYHDNDIVVVNKPAELLSVPGKAIEHRDSLQTRVQKRFPTATVVHRLDLPTSGVLLMPLTREAHRHIQQQFEKRQTQKTYIARVYGSIIEQEGEVNLPLICDWPNRPRQKVDHVQGKKALTRYRVISDDKQSSLVELIPVTGRSHQLRVHMMALGHPILGDRFYAHNEAYAMSERLLLHAEKLTITHPTTMEVMRFTSDCPFD